MKSIKYTQPIKHCLILPICILFTGLILITGTIPVTAQTNDPLLPQQNYIFDHNIDQAWNINTGSANTRIAIHSMAGFTSSHEDMSGARYLTPYTEWLGPEHDYASEVAGIVGANSNNGTGIAGIDWNAAMKSYNVLRKKQSGDNDPLATFVFDGEEFFFDTGKLKTMVSQAAQDNMDINVFTFGVPSAKLSDLKQLIGEDVDQDIKLTLTPSFPDPDPVNDFWNILGSVVSTIGESLWDAITGNNFTPPSDLELFRQELWKAAQPEHNSVHLAPVGDVQTQDQLDILMPAVMDNYVVTIAGAEKEQSGNFSHWPNSQSAPYVDVAAAATDIVSVSGTGFSSYNTNFSSTAAATGIAAGVVSLMRAENPSLIHDDLEEILKQTAIDIPPFGPNSETGHGLINAEAAVSYVRNNDIHHKQATSDNITINSDVEVYPNPVDMDRGYLIFTSTNACCPVGKLRKITGFVEFDQPFYDPPDVWLRMTSSGIDTTILPGDNHWYDPYDKAFEVLSVNENGFEFELYYWKTKFYNVASILTHTRNIPSTSQLLLDYTAVGEQAPPPPPPPPSVTIDGPTEVEPFQFLNYFANVSGGESPYEYSWEVQVGSSPWEPAGSTSESYTHLVESSEDFCLTVIVTDFNDDSSQVFQCVTVNSDPGFGFSEVIDLPENFNLDGNYPNPFNPVTTIEFALPEASNVTLEVFNIMGQKVATLVNESRTAGFHSVQWDASRFSSGAYFLRMAATGTSGAVFENSSRMTLIK